MTVLRVEGVTLADTHTEQRLVASMLWEEGILDGCPAVDLDDFTDARMATVFAAIRNLQADGVQVEVCTIEAHLADCDARLGRHALESLDRDFWINLFDRFFAPYNRAILLEHDKAWLRKLADRRGAA